MKSRRALVAWVALSAIFMMNSPAALAESEIEQLRREMRELQKTVQELNQIVREQNQRIENLTGGKIAKPSSQTDQEIQTKNDVSTEVATQNKLQPNSSSEDEEVTDLLKQVNQSPPAPGTTSRSIGLWRYPTPSSTAAKLLPDISLIGTFAAAYYSQDPSGEVDPNPTRTGFNLQEIELALQSTIDPYLHGAAFLSFGEEGVEVEEAYINTLGTGLPKGLGLKGGMFYTPFGRQNPKHLHAWSFVDQMLPNQYFFGADGMHDLGIEVSYLFPVPSFFQVQATFTNGDNDASFGGTRKQDFLYNGRLSGSVDLTDNLTALVGTSGAFGYNATGGGNFTHIYGGDFFLRWKPSARTSVSWQTEYMLRRMQLPGAFASDGGFYSYVDWQFFKQFHAGFRYEQMGIPSGVFAKEYRLSPMFSFDPSEFSRIRLQYDFDKIAGQDGHHAAFLQFQFSMGPHGAHSF